jgi:DNA repair protein RadC
MKAKDSAARALVGRPEDAARIVRKLMRAEQETFVVLCLDVRNRLISSHVVAIGTAYGVEVHPRDIFREAVRRNAAGIVVAHNHPSGDPTPSPEDVALTARLKSAGELLGIPVLDHVVVTTDRYASLAEWAES